MSLLAFLIFYVNIGMVVAMMDYFYFNDMILEYDEHYVVSIIGG